MDYGRERIEQRGGAPEQRAPALPDSEVDLAEAAWLLQETSRRVTILLGGALTVTTVFAFAHLAPQV